MTSTSKRHLKLLWHSMAGTRRQYAAAVIIMGFAALLGLIAPLVLRTTIDSILGDAPIGIEGRWLAELIAMAGGKTVVLHNLWLCAIMLALLSVAESVCLYLKGKWSALAAEATAQRIRDRVYDHLQHLSYDYHTNAETGDLIQRCTSDVDTIRQFLAVQFVEVGYALFLVAIVLPLMWSLDVTMTLISMAMIPVIFAFAFLFFKKAKQAFEASDEADGRLCTMLQENLNGVRVVRAFARQQHEIEKFAASNQEFRELTYHLIWLMAIYWFVSSLLGMIQGGVVLIAGAHQAAHGALTVGTLVVFISYVQRLFHPIRQMGRILTDMGKAMVSLERIQEILDQPIDASEAHLLSPRIHGDIEFRNVSFEYEPGKPVLQDISFTAKKGQTVAILGPTGAGKSSLVHLLSRLYDYQAGSITIDGVELKEVNKKWLRQHVGLVLQEPFMFSKTVKENIALAQKKADEAAVIEAARIAAVHDVIQSFEHGYDTSVGEKGVTLSGGQKQRVAIAQTLMKESPILVFDDSLSAVDTETDAAIRRALRARNGATTFMISHRVTTLSEADTILVLDGGRLVQTGSHEELIREDGLYRRIWAIQSELEHDLQTEMN